MLERRGRIDQASVEKDAARAGIGSVSVGERQRDRTPRKSDRIRPGQRAPAALELLGDDPPPRLVDRGKPAAPKLRQQRRLAAPGNNRKS
jgi:hypothetical protein